MKLKSFFTATVVAVLVVGAGLAGCQSAPQEVSLDTLFARLDKYDGKDVILDGFYFSGFEVNVLAEGLDYSGLGGRHIGPTGEQIWIEGSLDQSVVDSLYHQSDMGPAESFGKVRVTGRFEYGEGYGHLSSYEYRITPTASETLAWSPDELGPPPEPILETITPQAAFDLIEANQGNPDFVIIDVRSQTSFETEHIEGAVNIDSAAADFEAQLDALDKTKTYFVYCAAGHRSAAAGETMSALGFYEVYILEGGISQWQAAGLPTVVSQSE